MKKKTAIGPHKQAQKYSNIQYYTIRKCDATPPGHNQWNIFDCLKFVWIFVCLPSMTSKISHLTSRHQWSLIGLFWLACFNWFSVGLYLIQTSTFTWLLFFWLHKHFCSHISLLFWQPYSHLAVVKCEIWVTKFCWGQEYSESKCWKRQGLMVEWVSMPERNNTFSKWTILGIDVWMKTSDVAHLEIVQPCVNPEIGFISGLT